MGNVSSSDDEADDGEDNNSSPPVISLPHQFSDTFTSNTTHGDVNTQITTRMRSNSLEVLSPSPRKVVPKIPPKIIHKILTILYHEAVPSANSFIYTESELGSRRSWKAFLNFSSTCKTIYAMSWNAELGFRRFVKLHASHIILPQTDQSHSKQNKNKTETEISVKKHEKNPSLNVMFKIEDAIFPKKINTLLLRSRTQLSSQLINHLINVFDISRLDISAQPIPKPQDWTRMLNSWKLSYLNLYHTPHWSTQLASILGNSKTATLLKDLSLAQTPLDDRGISYIVGKTPCLLRLNLWRTRAGDLTLSTIAKNCPDIRVLDLRKTNISDVGLSALSTRKKCKLVRLSLDSTRITDNGIKKLADCVPFLSFLSVSNATSSTVQLLSRNHPSASIKVVSRPLIISKSTIPISKYSFSSIEDLGHLGNQDNTIVTLSPSPSTPPRHSQKKPNDVSTI